MDLAQNLEAYIFDQHLCNKSHDLLVAVSGGCDSMVLAYLLHKMGYSISIAHCNFQLRGIESDRDAQVVSDFCTQHAIPFYSKKFDTLTYIQENKLSTQEAARDLRYTWFSSLINPQTSKPFSFIATAHHANDNIETVLQNFFKGTGIKGLTGIAPKRNNIIRPLLFASRSQIESYAQSQSIRFVEDASNASNKYTRNFLRNSILPQVQEKYPQVAQNITQAIQRFTTLEAIYEEAIAIKRKKVVEQKGAELHIPILKLRKTIGWQSLLYEVVKDYGFTALQVGEIISLLDAANSSYISSATHRIIKNRNWIIIAPLATDASTFIIIEKNTNVVPFENGHLSVQLIATKEISDAANIALVDAKQVTLPMVLRKWKEGDYFYPLGMQKKKKVARFLIDAKLSKLEKEKVWVLESNKKIIWVVGYRIDNRFKVQETTTHCWSIIFSNQNADATTRTKPY
jgi:tRNA(Ile)-lysidine synthase